MKHPVRSLPQYRGSKCLNCDTPLEEIDKYCHQCGQLNSTKRLAFSDFFEEFFANLISYDNRIWRTISAIIFRPGKITSDYCDGKKVRYTNPFRFFLSVSIVFFLLLQLSIKLDPERMEPVNISRTDNTQGAFNLKIDSTVQNKQDLIDQLKEIEDSIGHSGSLLQKFIVSKAVEEMEQDSTAVTLDETSFVTQEVLDSMSFVKRYATQIENYANYYDSHRQLKPAAALEQLGHNVNKSNVFRYRKASKFQDLLSNPVAVLDILLPKIPLFLFFFAPALSLVFWLLYARRDFSYMEHMVFNFHLFTFIFLTLYFQLAELILLNTSLISGIFFTIIGPLYLYKAMRKFYSQSRIKTILKFLIINFVFLILLLISSSLFIVLSVFLSL